MELPPKKEFIMDFMQGYMEGSAAKFEALEVDEAKAEIAKAEGWVAGYYDSIKPVQGMMDRAPFDFSWVDEHIESLTCMNMDRLAKHFIEKADYKYIKLWLDLQEDKRFKEEMRERLTKLYKIKRAG